MSLTQDQANLRQNKRALRRALSSQRQDEHALQLANAITHHPRFLACKSIALYLANDGEINPIYVTEQAWSMGKQVFLPVLSPLANKLEFAPYVPGCNMISNRFGIMEPACTSQHWRRARHIDLMLLPLVAFDETGHRLGMGGGFYDRSLAHRKLRQHLKKPYLIGLAHECQKTESLESQSWDIPLDTIITEKTTYTV